MINDDLEQLKRRIGYINELTDCLTETWPWPTPPTGATDDVLPPDLPQIQGDTISQRIAQASIETINTAQRLEWLMRQAGVARYPDVDEIQDEPLFRAIDKALSSPAAQG